MSGEPLIWALLAPVPRDRLDEFTRKYWREVVSDSEVSYAKEGWEIVGGTGDYSAVLDRNPGSENTHDTPLAERLSRTLKRPVYVLYLNDRWGEVGTASVYKKGRLTGQHPEPNNLTRSLGVTLPVMNEAEHATARPVCGVVVVEGVSAADVARALGITELSNGPVHIVDGPVGAIMYNTTVDMPPLAGGRLSTAFPQTDVYVLATNRLYRNFFASVIRGGHDVGTLDSPATSADPLSGIFPVTPILDSVKGETTPRGIAAALGVPEGLMDLP
jgi:hypothetical protein